MSDEYTDLEYKAVAAAVSWDDDKLGWDARYVEAARPDVILELIRKLRAAR